MPDPRATGVSNPGDAPLRTLRILWGAFFASLGVYVVVAMTAAPPAEAAEDRHTPLMWILTLVAAVNLLTVTPLTRLLVGRTRAAGGGAEDLLAAHRVAFVVAAARVEAVAVLGLLLVLVSGRRDWFALFVGAAALGMLVLFPRPGDLGRPGQEGERRAEPIEP